MAMQNTYVVYTNLCTIFRESGDINDIDCMLTKWQMLPRNPVEDVCVLTGFPSKENQKL